MEDANRLIINSVNVALEENNLFLCKVTVNKKLN